MAIQPIYLYDSPVLRAKTLGVKSPTPELLRLILDMFETMHAARGIGLAANQVGRHESVFVVDLSELEDHSGFKPLVMINPDIREYFGDDVPYEEGCLSIPEIKEEIIRPERVSVKYLDPNFELHELEAEGLLARVIQHEFDHLNGVFFTDYLKGLKKKLLMPALKKIKSGDVEADYPIAAVTQPVSL